MALTTQNAAGLVAQGQAAPEARVKVRLLRAIRHLGEHVAAGEVLEVPRAQAVELRGMQKAEILPEGVAGADKAAPKKAPVARRGATPAAETAPATPPATASTPATASEEAPQ